MGAILSINFLLRLTKCFMTMVILSQLILISGIKDVLAAPSANSAKDEKSLYDIFKLHKKLSENNYSSKILALKSNAKDELHMQESKNFAQIKEKTSIQQPNAGTFEEYKIVLDPGHGGKSEKASKTEGDHWDIKARRFLTNYNFGAVEAAECEHKIVLEICRRAFEILNNANSDKGWREFSRMLSEYGRLRPEEYKRAKFNVALSRNDAYDSQAHVNEANVNRHFRLFDSPESFDHKKKPSANLYPGRMSKINSYQPELVVCVHVNSSTNRSVRGQASVIIPEYRVFEFVKNCKEKLGPKSSRAYFWVLSCMYPDNMILGRLSELTNDADTYFTGKRVNNKESIGKRWQMVKWRYNEDDEYSNLLNYKNSNSYWKRERSVYESMRRNGGYEGYGGDNFYASEEILRFIRLGLWKEYSESIVKDRTAVSVKYPDEYLGAHGRPFISDWALPQMVNAVTAYLELGYIENADDRAILVNKKENIAKSIAVAIYSLTCGLELKNIPLNRDELINSDARLKNLTSKTETLKTVPEADCKSSGQVLDSRFLNLLSELKNKVESKKDGKLKKELCGIKAAEAADITYSQMPLKTPDGKKIDFKKYGKYFIEVLK